MSDRDLQALMDRAMSGVEGEEALVSGAVRRGRRRVRRRHGLQLAGAGAAVAAVVTAAAVIPTVVDDDPAAPGTDPAVASTGTTQPQPTDPDDQGNRENGLPPDLQRLQDRLVAQFEGEPHPADAVAFTSVVADLDGTGPGEVRALFGPADEWTQTQRQQTCRRYQERAGGPECTVLPDGFLFFDRSLPDIARVADGLSVLRARYAGPDGVVEVYSYNSTDALDPDVEPTRPEPVLDRDDLVALVTDSGWFE